MAQDVRSIVTSVYKGEGWKKKVQKMSDSQVTAIYMSLKKQGKVR